MREIITMQEVPEAGCFVLPHTLQVLIDYCRRVGHGMAYKLVDITGSVLFHTNDVREVALPFYAPQAVDVGLEVEIPDATGLGLVAAASLARSNGFSAERDSKRYGCAVLGSSGRVYMAGQYSAFHGSGTVHSEVAAIYAAKMHNDTVAQIALSSDRYRNTCAEMCGNCRQCLAEITDLDGVEPTIHLTALNGKSRTVRIGDYLPASWSNKELI